MEVSINLRINLRLLKSVYWERYSVLSKIHILSSFSTMIVVAA